MQICGCKGGGKAIKSTDSLKGNTRNFCMLPSRIRIEKNFHSSDKSIVEVVLGYRGWARWWEGGVAADNKSISVGKYVN